MIQDEQELKDILEIMVAEDQFEMDERMPVVRPVQCNRFGYPRPLRRLHIKNKSRRQLAFL
jgi:hypothetical protein